MLALFVIHKNGLVFDSMANPLSKCCRTTTTAVMLVVCACLHQNRLDELFNWIRLVNNVIKISCDGMCLQLNYLISFLIDRQCCVRLIWIKNLCEMPKRPKRKTNKQQQRKKTHHCIKLGRSIKVYHRASFSISFLIIDHKFEIRFLFHRFGSSMYPAWIAWCRKNINMIMYLKLI